MHNDGSARPRIGIVGNPLIVFEPFMNDHVVEMLESLGCEPIMPDPALLTGDDVRYLDQLALFDEQGIHDVIYLLSFGCLKGHVSARGALRELHERFADMRITVIDYEHEIHGAQSREPHPPRRRRRPMRQLLRDVVSFVSHKAVPAPRRIGEPVPCRCPALAA